MLIRKAYKFRLNTNTETEQLMSQYAGNCRFLWNKALVMNLFKLENKQRLFYYDEFDWFSQLWKKSEEYSFLKLSPAKHCNKPYDNLIERLKMLSTRNNP